MSTKTIKNATIHLLKHLFGFAVIGVVLIGIIIAGVSIHSATKSKSAAQVAMNKVTDDGTTHDMTIVWPNGSEQNLSYSETITPRSSTYTGPKNLHQTETFALTLNPLDSATKAIENTTPSTFAEGDRPALVLTDTGVNASKTKGAETVGQGGADPAWGEYIGWVGILIIGLIGLSVIAGVGKWLYNSVWKPIEPTVSGLASAAVASVIPVKAPVVAQTAQQPAEAAATTGTSAGTDA